MHGVELPVRTLHDLDSLVKLIVCRLAIFYSGQLPCARGGLGRCIECAIGLLAPAIEEVEDFEEFGRDANGSVVGAGPA